MKIYICLDDNNGMMFNNRRISRDKEVIADILDDSKEEKLFLCSYSAPLFPESVIVNDNCLQDCESKDACFIENLPLSPLEDKIDTLVIYRWNRTYPSDFGLDIDLNSWRKISSVDFKGNSHEKITKEVYHK